MHLISFNHLIFNSSSLLGVSNGRFLMISLEDFEVRSIAVILSVPEGVEDLPPSRDAPGHRQQAGDLRQPYLDRVRRRLRPGHR